MRRQDLTFWGDGGRDQENRTFIISLAHKQNKKIIGVSECEGEMKLDEIVRIGVRFGEKQRKRAESVKSKDRWDRMDGL